MAQRVRRKGVDRRLQRGRSHQLRLVAVAPGMQDLQRNFTALLVYRIGNMAMEGKMAGVVQHRAARHGDAGRGGGNSAGDDQRHPVAGALGVKSRQPLRAVRELLQASMHRAHQHAVFERCEPQVKRGEKRRVAAHNFFQCKIIVMWSDELLI